MDSSGTSAIVLMCDGHQEDGYDLSLVSDLVTQLLPKASVGIVHNLCIRPGALARVRRKFVGDVVVLSLCKSHANQKVAEDDLRDAVRDRTIPRERIVIDNSSSFTNCTELQRARILALYITSVALADPLLTATLVPAVPAFEGIGRRALLKGRLREARAKPHLASGSCGASPLCHMCIDRCPESALAMRGGLPFVDAHTCTSCGACVTACPKDLILLDSLPVLEWEAYLRYILTAAGRINQPLGIWWICKHIEPPLNSTDDAVAWMQLRLPCMSAVTLSWILQPLAAGAKGVTVTPCKSCATHWAPGAVGSQLLQELLGVPTLEPSPGSTRWEFTTAYPLDLRIELREPTATAVALGRLHISNETFRSSSASPLGVVDCDIDRCTSCSLCVDACPTNALITHGLQDSWTLAFTHGKCAACGACVDSCPENALTLRRGIKSNALKANSVLMTAEVPRCEVCDAVLPSLVLRRRFATVGVNVPDDGICSDCRSMGRLLPRH